MTVFALDQSETLISVMWPACSNDGQWQEGPPRVGIIQIGPHLGELRHFCFQPIRCLDSGHVTHSQNCSQWQEGSFRVGVLKIHPNLAGPQPKICLDQSEASVWSCDLVPASWLCTRNCTDFDVFSINLILTFPLQTRKLLLSYFALFNGSWKIIHNEFPLFQWINLTESSTTVSRKALHSLLPGTLYIARVSRKLFYSLYLHWMV